jgi:hypothetical protein
MSGGRGLGRKAKWPPAMATSCPGAKVEKLLGSTIVEINAELMSRSYVNVFQEKA